MRLNKVTQCRDSFMQESRNVLKEVREVTGYNLEVDFQEHETAIHKNLKQEDAWHVQEKARRPVCLKKERGDDRVWSE